ncbi:BTAD domain-containing putative transcriptional regulator [Streptomyces sp. NPDC020898]|uniref:AfsR/SARP family transcriptional regulator n=1 Tax=Streptomyces sp. NPDC020898 TaxID=3365101 RepID=UPI003790F91A
MGYTTGIHVLGQVRLHDGAPIIKGTKTRALLVTLMLRANGGVSLETITESLWDGEPPRSAVANIRTQVSALRRVLDAKATLAGVPGGYRLDVPIDFCDHLRFLDQVAVGRAALADGDISHAIKPLATALSLWDGDRAAIGVPRYGPLHGWLNHLDEERTRAAEDLADAHIRLGEPHAALSHLSDLLAVSPLRGRSWELRMLAHHRLGELGQVSDAYRTAVATFRRELGIAPDDRLSTLHRTLLQS